MNPAVPVSVRKVLKRGAAKRGFYDDGQTLSNNGTRGKAGPLGANIYVANACFKRDVLRIETSDLHKNSKQTSLGIKD